MGGGAGMHTVAQPVSRFESSRKETLFRLGIALKRNEFFARDVDRVSRAKSFRLLLVDPLSNPAMLSMRACFEKSLPCLPARKRKAMLWRERGGGDLEPVLASGAVAVLDAQWIVTVE